MSYRVLFILAGVSLSAVYASAQLRVERLQTGIDRPIFAASAPGSPSILYIAQQNGTILSYNTATPAVAPTMFASIPAISGTNLHFPGGTEEGLLGMAFHPNFASNGQMYAYYTTNSGAQNRVDQFTVSGGAIVATSRKTVMSFNHPTNTNHNGGWIGFNPVGGTNNLYIATGDGGGSNDTSNNSQNTNSHLGKMLRVDVGPAGLAPAGTYAIPAGNMTINPNNGTIPLPEIYAYGLRNPFRNSFDRQTGDLYIGDVGQGAREEVDFIANGRVNTPAPASPTSGINFGWKLREGEIATPGVGGAAPIDNVEPIHTYQRPGGTGILLGRSITGGHVYRGPINQTLTGGTALNGTYLFADYVDDQVGSFRYSGSGAITNYTNRTTEIGTGIIGVPGGSIADVTAFAEDGFGHLYILDFSGGELYRVIPEPGMLLGLGLAVAFAARRRKIAA